MISAEQVDWMNGAACKGIDPQEAARIFFPWKNESQAEALSICAACPVKAECAEYAVDNPELQGVWGGTSERERRRIRISRSKVVAVCRHGVRVWSCRICR